MLLQFFILLHECFLLFPLDLYLDCCHVVLSLLCFIIKFDEVALVSDVLTDLVVYCCPLLRDLDLLLLFSLLLVVKAEVL